MGGWNERERRGVVGGFTPSTELRDSFGRTLPKPRPRHPATAVVRVPGVGAELSSACAASPTLWMAPQYIHARWHAYRCVTYVQRRAIVRIRTCVDASSRRHSPDDIVYGSCTACGRSECHRQRCPRIDDQLI
jgi:hypothetical protein